MNIITYLLESDANNIFKDKSFFSDRSAIPNTNVNHEIIKNAAVGINTLLICH